MRVRVGMSWPKSHDAPLEAFVPTWNKTLDKSSSIFEMLTRFTYCDYVCIHDCNFHIQPVDACESSV